MDSLNVEEVLALAPDAPTAEAGRNLSNPARWHALGRTEERVWGECQAGGGGPERCHTQVDLGSEPPSFHCSCPSRRSPCKHGMGLLLLFTGNPARVPESAAPAWLLQPPAAKRSRREKKTAVVAPDAAPANPPDPRAAALEELQAWLADLIRHGLRSAREQPPAYFESMAARLAATRTPGLARRLREWPKIFGHHGGPAWADRALEELSAVQLLLNRVDSLDELPAGPRASLYTALGWTIDEKEFLAGQSAADRLADLWLSIGRRYLEDGAAGVRRTWFIGREAGRTAFCTSAATDRRALDAVPPGVTAEADLAFYPAPVPLRASVMARRSGGEDLPFQRPAVQAANFEEALAHSLTLLKNDPWLEVTPWLVRGCTPAPESPGDGPRWTLHDETYASVPLAPDFSGAWRLLAVSGGLPVTLFGEWDGRALYPLSALLPGGLINLEERRVP